MRRLLVLGCLLFAVPAFAQSTFTLMARYEVGVAYVGRWGGSLDGFVPESESSLGGELESSTGFSLFVDLPISDVDQVGFYYSKSSGDVRSDEPVGSSRKVGEADVTLYQLGLTRNWYWGEWASYAGLWAGLGEIEFKRGVGGSQDGLAASVAFGLKYFPSDFTEFRFETRAVWLDTDAGESYVSSSGWEFSLPDGMFQLEASVGLVFVW